MHAPMADSYLGVCSAESHLTLIVSLAIKPIVSFKHMRSMFYTFIPHSVEYTQGIRNLEKSCATFQTLAL